MFKNSLFQVRVPSKNKSKTISRSPRFLLGLKAALRSLESDHGIQGFDHILMSFPFPTKNVLLLAIISLTSKMPLQTHKLSVREKTDHKSILEQYFASSILTQGLFSLCNKNQANSDSRSSFILANLLKPKPP